MENNQEIYKNDEIDLSELFKTLWSKKKTIAIIALTSFVIIFTYSSSKPKKPDLFNNSLIINPAKEIEFLSLVPIIDFLNEGKLEENFFIKELNSKELLNRFIEEFLDYDELITILKNNENIKKNISQLSKYGQQKELYRYAKLFTMTDTEMSNYLLRFTWQDRGKESREIIDQALKLTSKSIDKSIFKEIETYYKIKKDLIIDKDLARIEFLIEQSSIAKRLNIEEKNQNFTKIDEFQFPKLDNIGNVSFSFNESTNDPYYSRGFKAIDIEINAIKNRRYRGLEKIRKKIDLLKERNINWVDYNIFFLETEQKNKKDEGMSLFIIILFSLIIGVLYALVSNSLQSQRAAKEID